MAVLAGHVSPKVDLVKKWSNTGQILVESGDGGAGGAREACEGRPARDADRARARPRAGRIPAPVRVECRVRRGRASSDADPRRPNASRMPAERRSNTGRTPAECRPNAGRMPAECRSNAGRTPAECGPNAGRKHVENRSMPISNRPATFPKPVETGRMPGSIPKASTGRQAAKYRSDTGPIPAQYRGRSSFQCSLKERVRDPLHSNNRV